MWLWRIFLLQGALLVTVRAGGAKCKTKCQRKAARGRPWDKLCSKKACAACQECPPVLQAKCTPWCLKQTANGRSWDDLCPKSKCAACEECTALSPTPVPTTPPSTPPPPTQPPTSQTECKPWCHGQVEQGRPWDELCPKSKCSACQECGSPSPAPPPSPTPTSAPTNAADLQYRLESGAGFSEAVAAVLVGQRAGLLGPSPAGLAVASASGVLTWQPDASQAGVHWVEVAVTAADGSVTEHKSVKLTVVAAAANPDAWYVWPSGGSDGNAGDAAAPFATVAHAVAQAQPGEVVYIRGGVYGDFQETVVGHGTGDDLVLVTHLDGERVRLTPPPDKNAFYVPEDSVGLVFRGLELYGGAEKDDHWDILAHSWWRVEDRRVGGKMAFDIDGQHIVVEDCVIHDFSQKAVNVKIGRYVTVRHNVIFNIGHSSLSGGHGLMRQWDHSFGDDDDPGLFRFDFVGNLLFGVEQRIYSFIPRKKYCHMVIDEGKGILIDETNDEAMKARISHNLVLWGGVDGIRIKFTPNLQVENNAVVGEQGRTDPMPDGITATATRAPMPGLRFTGNLAHTPVGSWALDVSKHVCSDGHPANLNHNYYSGGGAVRDECAGVEPLADNETVFRDAAGLDFRAAAHLPLGAGVDEAVLDRLFGLAANYSVAVAPSGWRHDHGRNTEAILAARPAEHLGEPVEGNSKKEPGKKALFVPVLSDWYRDLCRCDEIELIPPPQYWGDVSGH